MSNGCLPIFCLHTCVLLMKFVMTFAQRYDTINTVYALNLGLKLENCFYINTRFHKTPQKKTHDLKSRDFTCQLMSPFLEIERPGNCCRNKSIVSLAV